MVDPSVSRVVFTHRWWRTTGLFFALFGPLGYLATYPFHLLAGIDAGYRWSETIIEFAIGGIVGPFSLAAILATLHERAAPPDMPPVGTRRLVRNLIIALGFSIALGTGPLALALFARSMFVGIR